MREWNTLISSVLAVLLSLTSISLGALAWSHTSSLYLPIPAWIPAATTLLSPLLGIILVVLSRSLRNTSERERTLCGIRIQQFLNTLNQLHTIISTILATLVVAYLFPERILSCNLEQQWQQFFQAKNTEAIRTIQDRLQCCGLRSTHDRAWPFKDKTHGDNACELQLGYSRSCAGSWMGRQQKASWMTFAAVLLIVIVKVGVTAWNNRQTSWMDSAFPAAEREPGEYRRITNEQVDTESGDNLRSSGAVNDQAAWE